MTDMFKTAKNCLAIFRVARIPIKFQSAHNPKDGYQMNFQRQLRDP